MCRLYSLVGDIRELELRFDFDDGGLEYRQRFSVAPTQAVQAVTNDGGRQAVYMRCVLIPS